MTDLLPQNGSILERAGVTVTPTSLTVTDPDLPYETMEQILDYLGGLEQGADLVKERTWWWVADALIAAESMYGELFSQLEAATGLAPQTLTNRVSIARRIPPERRRPALSPSVQAEVAYLEPREQKRLLDKAEKEGLTKSQVRDEVRETKGVVPPETCTCSECGHEHRKPSL